MGKKKNERGGEKEKNPPHFPDHDKGGRSRNWVEFSQTVENRKEGGCKAE